MSYRPTDELHVEVARDGEPSGSAAAAGHIDVDVLVVGAGPTGLTAACEAIRHGLSVRIVDRKPYRSTFSKALVAHARTLAPGPARFALGWSPGGVSQRQCASRGCWHIGAGGPGSTGPVRGRSR